MIKVFCGIGVILVFGFNAAASELKPVTLALAGSSSCQTFNRKDPKLIFGWGEVIGEFFKPECTVKNFARSGRSTTTFRSLGHWKKLLASKPDYILMTLGANDTPGKKSYSDPKTVYRDNLRRFAAEAKQIGAKMIFVTINQSMQFTKGKVTFNRQGQAVRKDRIKHSQAVREVAAELKLPCLELATNHQKELEAMGEKEAVKLFRYDPKRKGIDPSHSNRKGATLMAKIIVEELAKSNSPLKKYINTAKLR